jgi:hypothetical protein
MHPKKILICPNVNDSMPGSKHACRRPLTPCNCHHTQVCVELLSSRKRLKVKLANLVWDPRAAQQASSHGGPDTIHVQASHTADPHPRIQPQATVPQQSHGSLPRQGQQHPQQQRQSDQNAGAMYVCLHISAYHVFFIIPVCMYPACACICECA